jgi:hypothetical protein
MTSRTVAVAPFAVALAAVGCGGGDGDGATPRRAPTAATPAASTPADGLAGACGLDPQQWRAGLAAAVQLNPVTRSLGSVTDPGSAYVQALGLRDSRCLVGRRRSEVVALLGGGGGDGDGRVFFLGTLPSTKEGLALELDYTGDRLARARAVEGD